MHEVSNSCLPVRSSADWDSSATATWGVGVKVAAVTPATDSPSSSSTAADTRRRKRRCLIVFPAAPDLLVIEPLLIVESIGRIGLPIIGRSR